MNLNIKNRIWPITAIILLSGCVIAGIIFLNLSFKETRIYPDNSRIRPMDTTFCVNDVEFKMIGISGGKIDCKGLKKTIELNDFYIGETEVTQELWMAVMNYNPSINRDDILCPVENVDLVECLDFVHRLDSISGYDFHIQSYPEWLYVARLGSTGIVKSENNLVNASDSIISKKENSSNKTYPVKQKKNNTLGVYGMIGNVSEWTVSGSNPLFFCNGW